MTPLGLDFGTTNSVLAAWNGSAVEVIAIDTPPVEWAQLGFDRVLPSVLGVSEGTLATFGWAAKRQDTAKLEAVKRLFATDDHVDIGGTEFSVELAAALLFGHIRDRAAANGLHMDRSVVTIPANSRGIARFRTKLCAGLAGIEVPALVNEPTAAAMAHGINAKDDCTILVFDWGGGTLDVTVLEAVSGVFMELASKGIQRLGGIDVDEVFGEALIDLLPSRPLWSEAERAQFRLEVERAKILLSTQTETNVRLPNGTYVTATKALFEQSARPLLDQLRRPIEQCLNDLGISPGGIDHLVMVGGSSKIPAARELVSTVLQKEAAGGCDPMTAVAEGAAIASAIMAGQLDMEFFVSTEHALGTIANDEHGDSRFSVIIPRNHQLPAKREDGYLPSFDGQEQVRIHVIEGDPDVALDHPDNVILKEWEVKLDPEKSAIEQAFTLTYDYDVDGILHVSAVNDRTGAEILRDDVSFGVTRDKRELVRIRTEVTTILETGTIGDAPPGAPRRVGQALPPDVAELVERARSKVIPFVDDDEAERLTAIVSDLESAAGPAVSECKAALETELRKYAFLF